MKNRQNVTIVLLLAAAAILGAMLFISNQTAVATNMIGTAPQSDYILIPFRISDQENLMCVIDQNNRKMVCYGVDITRKTVLTVGEPLDLAKASAE